MRPYSPAAPRKRRGKILALLVLLLPVLAGMTGLVVDGCLLMVAHRRAQNAADAAALAAALDLLQGSSDVTGTVNRYVTQYNGLTRATAEVHVGPNQGPYRGNRQFV